MNMRQCRTIHARSFRRGRGEFLRSLLGASLVLALVACRKEEEEGQPPPPPAPALPHRCATVADAPLDGLPGRVGDFCLDPNIDVRRYGEGTASPLDDVCIELFNGECEVYKSYGLEGVKTTSFVSSERAGTTISVVVSRFRQSDGAFGFFTRRIIGDGLPSDVTVSPLEVEGRAAIGPGVLYVWRGKQVVELSYVSEVETPAEVEENSRHILKRMATSIASLLIGSTSPNRGVSTLEAMKPPKFGVVVRSDGLLGMLGTGDYANAFFEADSEGFPHRLVTAQRRDEAAASDLIKYLARSFPSKKFKATKIHRIRWSGEGRPPQTWYFTQRDNLVLGVGPLDRVDAPSTSSPESRKDEARRWETYATRRLAELKSASSKAMEQ